MSRSRRVLLTLRTVRHLRPSQVGHRVRLRAQRAAVQAAPRLARRVLQAPGATAPGWPAGFVPLDGRVSAPLPPVALLAAGRIELLGHERPLEDFRSTEPPQLWRYHLHYWDWAWALVRAEDRSRGRAVFSRLLRQWEEQTGFGRWDEWSPYVVALRAWSWCGQYDALARGTEADQRLVDLLALHHRFLRAHLELDVGGNHLVKDLKALVGLGVFFGDRRSTARALRRLRVEVRRQVLPDGGHVERAPAYHCQVLADLVDVSDLLGAEAPSWLLDAMARMRAWLGLVLLPDGAVPLLNDGFPVADELVRRLSPGPAAPEGLTLLPDSGFAVLRLGQAHVLADVGLPCPDDLPAHAHADTLGFLLHVGTERVVGELGTSTYRPGAERDLERSTAAHSTLEVDGQSSTEVWGAFRAARRARPTLLRAEQGDGAVVLSASHDGYRRLPGRPVHRRTWTLHGTGLRITDELTGAGEHEVAVRLHGTRPEDVLLGREQLATEGTSVAQGWEQRSPGSVLVHRARATLPWRFELELSTTRGST